MADTNNPNLPKKSGSAIGASGTYITGGIITLEEYNRKLMGRHGLTQYDIMRRSDSTIRSIMQVVKLPLLAATWGMQPATIDKKDPDAKTKQEQADYKARFIQRELMGRNVNFNDLLKDMLTALEFGFDVEEKTLEVCDFEGQLRIGIKEISKRKQTTILRWETDDTKLPGVVQILPDKTVSIPMEKLIVFTHEKEGDNYEGIPMLRYVYKDWDIKDKLTIVNAIAIEKLAVGVPVIEPKADVTPSEEDRNKAIDHMQNFRANQSGYIYLPTSLGVSMLDLKSNSTKDVIPTLQYHDRRISQSILAQFMDLGGKSGSGSQSLAKDLTSLYMKSEAALATLITSTLQAQLIKQLCDFNFTDMSEGYPQLVATNLADDDVTAISSAMSSLVTAGAMTPDADLEDHLRELLGAPKLPEEIRNSYQDYRPKQIPAPTDTTPNANDPVPPKNTEELKKAKDKKKADALEQIKASRLALIEAEYGR